MGVRSANAEIGDDVTLTRASRSAVWRDPGQAAPDPGGRRGGAGAAVLGPFTVGRGARIGSNAVVLQAVEPHSTVVGVPGHAVARRPAVADKSCFPAYGNEPGASADPVLVAIDQLCARVEQLENELAGVRAQVPPPLSPELAQAEPARPLVANLRR